MPNALYFAISFKNADYSCEIAIPNSPLKLKSYISQTQSQNMLLASYNLRNNVIVYLSVV